jgi:hypothetical protein
MWVKRSILRYIEFITALMLVSLQGTVCQFTFTGF